ncbi:hypothetical protein ACHAXT_009184 [Thalassiosira profunda]
MHRRGAMVRKRPRCSSAAAAALLLALARRDAPLLAEAFASPYRGRVASLNGGGSSMSPQSSGRLGQVGALHMATVPKEASTATALAPAKPAGGRSSSKLRQLKDRMWVREALEDITAAEFASSLSVEDSGDETSSASSAEGGEKKIWEGKSKRKRAVDFDNILNKLDLRIEEMCVLASPEAAKEMGQTCHVLSRNVGSSDDGEVFVEETCYALSDGMGMGSVVYTNEQREALLERLIGTRERLVSFIEGSVNEAAELEGEDIDDIRSKLQPEDGSVKTNGAAEETSSAKATFDPSLYVREDGTVDWDGALQDREALKKFGNAVWSRINGQEPDESNGEGGEEGAVATTGGDEFHSSSSGKAVTAKIEETDAIREKRGELGRLVEELSVMEKENTKLLNSAIGASQAVANVNLATVEASLRNQIRQSSQALEMKRTEATFRTLDYELERIYTYLEGELGNTAAKGYIPLQDRLNVAEFGLLESQIDSFSRQMELGENLDADVLAVVADQLVDFKRRLGIDYYVAGLTFDSEAIQVWLRDVWVKTKNGVAFYVKGTRLFADDVAFCTGLILRALQGYTLKPREVRTLRRTFKDTITFIPVVIILLIPLSPIGHVLVFGAIQRVFPDFFPSCFTERRQNLLELYESTEYTAVTINETWTQKLVRISQALRILTMRLITKVYMSLGGVLAQTSGDSNDSKGPSSE